MPFRPCETDRSISPWGSSTIPLSSRHLCAPTHFHLAADHPLPALMGQVVAMGNQSPLLATGQERVLVTIGDIGEVLAGHTDPTALALAKFPLLNEVPFLLRHQTF